MPNRIAENHRVYKMLFDEELTEDLDACDEDSGEDSIADSEEQDTDPSLPVMRCTIDR